MSSVIKERECKNPFFIDLPQRSDDVFFVIEFPYGYANETDSQFGLGHYYEHYVGELLLRMGLDISGSIGLHDMRYEMKTTKKRAQKDIARVVSFFNTPLPDVPEIVSSEKDRVLMELLERQSDPLFHMRELTLGSCIQKPARFRRPRWAQVDTVEKMTVHDMVTLHHTLVTAFSPAVAIGGYRFSATEKRMIEKELAPLRLDEKTNIPEIPLATFSPRKVSRIHTPLVPRGATRCAFFFPAYPLPHELVDRIIVGFLTRMLAKRFAIEAKKFGVYRTDHEYFISASYGFVRFFLMIPEGKESAVSTMFSRLVVDMTESLDFEHDLRAYVRDRKRVARLTREHNADLMEWMSSDLSSLGRSIGPREVIEALDEIALPRVKCVHTEIFASSAMRTLYFSAME